LKRHVSHRFTVKQLKFARAFSLPIRHIVN
jgi:hypothetical protein